MTRARMLGVRVDAPAVYAAVAAAGVVVCLVVGQRLSAVVCAMGCAVFLGWRRWL